MRSNVPSSINLASEPFRRERVEMVAYAAVCAFLACSLLVLLGLDMRERGELTDLRRQIAAEDTRLRELQSQQSKYSGVLSRPENADIFAKSVFLNELISRRGVSWTRVFKDFDTVMPANMRLLAIRLPQLGATQAEGANRVQLDMVVGTVEPTTVISLLRNLQQSSLFGEASVVNQSPPAQNDPLFKFRVTVPYDQKL